MPENSAYMTGKMLLAMPSMADPRFARAVVYVCVHDENGAMGLVINKPLADVRLEGVLKDLGIKDTVPGLLAQVMSGGPVEAARGFLLHSTDFLRPETIRMAGPLYLTGTLDGLKAVAQGKGPGQYIFLLGYAGWGAGQLDAELKQNSWLVADADPALVFAPDHDQKWDKAVSALGFHPSRLSYEQGRA